MDGFLGTTAGFGADLALVLTWIFGAVATVGAINAHRRRISGHCPLMAVGAFLNWLPVLIVMIPTWLEVAGSGAALPTENVNLASLGHGILGAVTQILMTYTVTRMYWFEDLPPRQPLWLMRVTMAMWVLTLIGGTFVYSLLYVL
ncbi:MAG: hypothetical protein ACP5GX_07430 [Anaerolineae bacterium]